MMAILLHSTFIKLLNNLYCHHCHVKMCSVLVRVCVHVLASIYPKSVNTHTHTLRYDTNTDFHHLRKFELALKMFNRDKQTQKILHAYIKMTLYFIYG